MLTGPACNAIQVFGLELLMIEEAYEDSEAKGRAMVDAVKHAVIAHEGVVAVERMYPEWFSQIDDEITDEDIEDSTGTWIFTNEKTDLDDIEGVLQKMGQGMQGMSVSGLDTERLREAAARNRGAPVSDSEEGWI